MPRFLALNYLEEVIGLGTEFDSLTFPKAMHHADGCRLHGNTDKDYKTHLFSNNVKTKEKIFDYKWKLPGSPVDVTNVYCESSHHQKKIMQSDVCIKECCGLFQRQHADCSSQIKKNIVANASREVTSSVPVSSNCPNCKNENDAFGHQQNDCLLRQHVCKNVVGLQREYTRYNFPVLNKNQHQLKPKIIRHLFTRTDEQKCVRFENLVPEHAFKIGFEEIELGGDCFGGADQRKHARKPSVVSERTESENERREIVLEYSNIAPNSDYVSFNVTDESTQLILDHDNDEEIKSKINFADDFDKDWDNDSFCDEKILEIFEQLEACNSLEIIPNPNDLRPIVSNDSMDLKEKKTAVETVTEADSEGENNFQIVDNFDIRRNYEFECSDCVNKLEQPNIIDCVLENVADVDKAQNNLLLRNFRTKDVLSKSPMVLSEVTSSVEELVQLDSHGASLNPNLFNRDLQLLPTMQCNDNGKSKSLKFNDDMKLQTDAESIVEPELSRIDAITSKDKLIPDLAVISTQTEGSSISADESKERIVEPLTGVSLMSLHVKEAAPTIAFEACHDIPVLLKSSCSNNVIGNDEHVLSITSRCNDAYKSTPEGTDTSLNSISKDNLIKDSICNQLVVKFGSIINPPSEVSQTSGSITTSLLLPVDQQTRMSTPEKNQLISMSQKVQALSTSQFDQTVIEKSLPCVSKQIVTSLSRMCQPIDESLLQLNQPMILTECCADETNTTFIPKVAQAIADVTVSRLEECVQSELESDLPLIINQKHPDTSVSLANNPSISTANQVAISMCRSRWLDNGISIREFDTSVAVSGCSSRNVSNSNHTNKANDNSASNTSNICIPDITVDSSNNCDKFSHGNGNRIHDSNVHKNINHDCKNVTLNNNNFDPCKLFFTLTRLSSTPSTSLHITPAAIHPVCVTTKVIQTDQVLPRVSMTIPTISSRCVTTNSFAFSGKQTHAVIANQSSDNQIYNQLGSSTYTPTSSQQMNNQLCRRIVVTVPALCTSNASVFSQRESALSSIQTSSMDMARVRSTLLCNNQQSELPAISSETCVRAVAKINRNTINTNGCNIFDVTLTPSFAGLVASVKTYADPFLSILRDNGILGHLTSFESLTSDMTRFIVRQCQQTRGSKISTVQKNVRQPLIACANHTVVGLDNHDVVLAAICLHAAVIVVENVMHSSLPCAIARLQELIAKNNLVSLQGTLDTLSRLLVDSEQRNHVARIIHPKTAQVCRFVVEHLCRSSEYSSTKLVIVIGQRMLPVGSDLAQMLASAPGTRIIFIKDDDDLECVSAYNCVIVEANRISETTQWLRSVTMIIEYAHSSDSRWPMVCAELGIDFVGLKISAPTIAETSCLLESTIAGELSYDNKVSNAATIVKCVGCHAVTTSDYTEDDDDDEEDSNFASKEKLSKPDILLVAAHSVVRRTALLNALETLQNIVIIDRDYENLKQPQHSRSNLDVVSEVFFEDICIDAHVCIILQDVAFLKPALERLATRVAGLQRKFASCWVLLIYNSQACGNFDVNETAGVDAVSDMDGANDSGCFISKDTNSVSRLIGMLSVVSSKLQGYQTKVVHCRSNAHVAEMIRVLSEESCHKSDEPVRWMKRNWIERDASIEECWLLANFSCLNSFSAQMLLQRIGASRDILMHSTANQIMHACPELSSSVLSAFMSERQAKKFLVCEGQHSTTSECESHSRSLSLRNCGQSTITLPSQTNAGRFPVEMLLHSGLDVSGNIELYDHDHDLAVRQSGKPNTAMLASNAANNYDRIETENNRRMNQIGNLSDNYLADTDRSNYDYGDRSSPLLMMSEDDDTEEEEEDVGDYDNGLQSELLQSISEHNNVQFEVASELSSLIKSESDIVSRSIPEVFYERHFVSLLQDPYMPPVYSNVSRYAHNNTSNAKSHSYREPVSSQQLSAVAHTRDVAFVTPSVRYSSPAQNGKTCTVVSIDADYSRTAFMHSSSARKFSPDRYVPNQSNANTAPNNSQYCSMQHLRSQSWNYSEVATSMNSRANEVPSSILTHNQSVSQTFRSSLKRHSSTAECEVTMVEERTGSRVLGRKQSKILMYGCKRSRLTYVKDPTLRGGQTRLKFLEQ